MPLSTVTKCFFLFSNFLSVAAPVVPTPTVLPMGAPVPRPRGPPPPPGDENREVWGGISGMGQIGFSIQTSACYEDCLSGPCSCGRNLEPLSARQGEAQMSHTGCTPCPERLESFCALYLSILPVFGLCVLHACSHALLLSSWDRVCSSSRILWVIPRGQRSLQGTYTPFRILFLGIPLGWAALPRDPGGAC